MSRHTQVITRQLEAFVAVICIAGLQACFPSSGFMEQKKSIESEVQQVKLLDTGDKVVASVQASSTSPQLIKTDSRPELEGVELLIQPGTLQIDMNIELEEAESLSSAKSASELGLSYSEPAGRAIVLANDKGIEELPEQAPPMTLQLAISSGSGLRLEDSNSKALVAFMRQSLSNGDCLEQVYPPNLVTVSANRMRVDVRRFASYQAQYMPTDELDALRDDPEKFGDDGIISIRRPGCRVVRKSETKQLEPATIELTRNEFKDSKFYVDAKISGGEIESCYLVGRGSYDNQSWELDSASSKFILDLSSQYTEVEALFAVGCSLKDARELETDYFELSLPAPSYTLGVEINGRILTATSTIKSNWVSYCEVQGKDLSGDIYTQELDQPENFKIDFSDTDDFIAGELRLACKAKNGAKLETNAVEFSLESQNIAPPIGPSGFTSNTQLTYSWPSVAGKSYRFQVSTNAKDVDFLDLTISDASYTFTAQPGRSYYVRIAYEGETLGAFSDWTEPVSVDTLAPAQPQAPQSPEAPVTNAESITFNWLDSSDADSGIAGYMLRIGNTAGGNEVFEGMVTTSSYQLNATAASMSYFASVAAIDRAGNQSDFSTSSVGVFIDRSPPLEVEGLIFTNNSVATQVKLTAKWFASSDDYSQIASYQVNLFEVSNPSSPIEVLNTTELSVDFFDKPQGEYFFEVVAFDLAGNASSVSASSNSVIIELGFDVLSISEVSRLDDPAAGLISRYTLEMDIASSGGVMPSHFCPQLSFEPRNETSSFYLPIAGKNISQFCMQDPTFPDECNRASMDYWRPHLNQILPACSPLISSGQGRYQVTIDVSNFAAIGLDYSFTGLSLEGFKFIFPNGDDVAFFLNNTDNHYYEGIYETVADLFRSQSLKYSGLSRFSLSQPNTSAANSDIVFPSILDLTSSISTGNILNLNLQVSEAQSQIEMLRPSCFEIRRYDPANSMSFYSGEDVWSFCDFWTPISPGQYSMDVALPSYIKPASYVVSKLEIADIAGNSSTLYFESSGPYMDSSGTMTSLMPVFFSIADPNYIGPDLISIERLSIGEDQLVVRIVASEPLDFDLASLKQAGCFLFFASEFEQFDHCPSAISFEDDTNATYDLEFTKADYLSNNLIIEIMRFPLISAASQEVTFVYAQTFEEAPSERFYYQKGSEVSTSPIINTDSRPAP